MLVKEVMSKNPDALTDDMTIKQAAAEMKKFDFGFLPVKHDGKLVGIVTDRDIVIRGLANGIDSTKATLKDIMTTEIFFCHEDDDVKKIADMMSQKQVHRLAVYDKNNQLSGVISIGDIARKCHDTALCGKLTEAIHQK
jgi:CBS domain-containing protein